MKWILAVIVLGHGLIHLMGFAKAFNLATISELRYPIPAPLGLLWLLAAILFVLSAVMLLVNASAWWIVSIAAVILSQVLIFTSWADARFGTIANIVIAAALLLTSEAGQAALRQSGMRHM